MALLRPFAAIYKMVVMIRTVLYKRGWLATRKLPARVISVGNLTVGGTGKTPMVIWIVEQLLSAGVKVAVLSRGYRRDGSASRVLVSDGQRLLVGPSEAGDEPYLIAKRCPGAVVAVGADRYELGRWVLDSAKVDCFILDDGFQHLGLSRDLDLLLVDASDPDGLRDLLPAGRLREPLSAARRATEVIVTRVNHPGRPDVWATLRSHRAPLAVPIRVAFRAEKLVELRTGMAVEIRALKHQPAVAFSGIGNPASFRHLLDRYGFKVVKQLTFRDHHAYSTDDVAAIKAAAVHHGADLILTTEKDAVKVEPLMADADRLWAIRLECDVIEGRDRLEQLILGGPRPKGAKG